MKKSTLILSLTLVAAMPKNIESKTDETSDCKTDTLQIYDFETLYTDIFGTVYHPVQEQTDDTPLITADGSRIDPKRINELRWVALSRDLLNLKTSRYNFTGKIKFGDTIYVESFDERIRGYWIVKDSMGAYYWQEQKNADSTDVKYLTKQYKIENGKVFKKISQEKWIDFLQDPKTGFCAAWKKRDIIIKKRVLRQTVVKQCNEEIS